jgi:hypothetical protein
MRFTKLDVIFRGFFPSFRKRRTKGKTRETMVTPELKIDKVELTDPNEADKGFKMNIIPVC